MIPQEQVKVNDCSSLNLEFIYNLLVDRVTQAPISLLGLDALDPSLSSDSFVQPSQSASNALDVEAWTRMSNPLLSSFPALHQVSTPTPFWPDFQPVGPSCHSRRTIAESCSVYTNCGDRFTRCNIPTDFFRRIQPGDPVCSFLTMTKVHPRRCGSQPIHRLWEMNWEHGSMRD